MRLENHESEKSLIHVAQISSAQAGMIDGSIVEMRKRATTCRRLADLNHDEVVRSVLIELANEIEANIQRLEAQQTTKMPNPQR